MIAASPEKLDTGIGRISVYGLVFIAGWLSCSAYYGTLNLKYKEQTLQHVQTVDIPKLKAAAKCEGRRADVASVVAGKAITGAVVDNAPIPSPKEIPKDNCPHPAVK